MTKCSKATKAGSIAVLGGLGAFGGYKAADAIGKKMAMEKGITNPLGPIPLVWAGAVSGALLGTVIAVFGVPKVMKCKR